MPSSPALDALMAELKAAQAELGPIIEGLEDYNRLNILPPTKAAVDEALALAKNRMAKINSAITALEQLADSGYPDLNTRQVTEAVYSDLAAQEATISAALAKFAPIAEAATVAVVPGAPTEQ